MKNNHARIKVWIFHPMQQHSYKTAEALVEEDLLDTYWTSIYYQPNKVIYKLLNLILDESSIKRMKNRKDVKLDPYIKTKYVILGLLFILSGKIDKTGKLSNFLQYTLARKMGKLVARKAMHEEVDIIIGYDTWSHGLIHELKKHNSKIKIIMDYSSLYSEEIIKIIKSDIDKYGSPIESYQKTLNKYTATYLQAFRYEKNNADYYLSPSSVVDNSLCDYGVEKDKIFRCTYGSYFKKIAFKNKHYNTVTFIYIGRMSYAKGVHYLIDAFNDIERNDCKLLLVGANTDQLTEKIINPNIIYVGLVHHDEIPRYLAKSDIVISASLYDGFSLAILEAVAYNLPILCTKKNGAVDYVIDGKTGIAFDIQSKEQILSAVNFLMEHKESISMMSQNVGGILNKLTWDNYEKNVCNAVRSILNFRE